MLIVTFSGRNSNLFRLIWLLVSDPWSQYTAPFSNESYLSLINNNSCVKVDTGCSGFHVLPSWAGCRETAQAQQSICWKTQCQYDKNKSILQHVRKVNCNCRFMKAIIVGYHLPHPHILDVFLLMAKSSIYEGTAVKIFCKIFFPTVSSIYWASGLINMIIDIGTIIFFARLWICMDMNTHTQNMNKH